MRTTLKNLHKISGSRISECQLSLLSGCREKKTRASQSGGFQRQRSHGCSIRPPTPTCPVADSPTLADAAGWGRRFLKLVGGAREDFDSQHAQSLCQLALPAFIRWNGGEKESPLKGGGQVGRVEGRGGTYIYIRCSFEQSIPKTSSVELPFSHGQSLSGQRRPAGGRLHTSPVYLTAAFSTNSSLSM